MLNQAGYSMLAYDLRGHGRSAGVRGHVSSFEEYLRDTDLLLQETKSRLPEAPGFLYGHSMGANIAAYYVLERKPRLNGVVLSALAIRSALQEQKVKIFIAKVLGSLISKLSMKSGLVPETISKDPEVVRAYINDPLVYDRITAAWGKVSLDSLDWIDQHASEWTLPVLIMHGELDQLGYAAGSTELASRIRGDCTLKIWTGMTHEIHHETEKDEVFEFLRHLLDRHADRSL